jgi:hypothetical protein
MMLVCGNLAQLVTGLGLKPAVLDLHWSELSVIGVCMQLMLILLDCGDLAQLVNTVHNRFRTQTCSEWSVHAARLNAAQQL